MDKLRDVTKEIQELDKLLDCWHKADDYDWSFHRDGFLSNKFDGILFIAKEPHCETDEPISQTEEEKHQSFEERKDSFWFKKTVYRDVKEISPWLVRRVLLLHECVQPKIDGETASDQFCSKIKEKRRDLSPLKNSAYINIKKTGGGNQTNYNNLYSYIEKNKCKIHKQLKIISPEVVVICGTENGFYENVKALVEDALKDKNVQIFSAYHPSPRFPFRYSFNTHIKYFMDKKKNEVY